MIFSAALIAAIRNLAAEYVRTESPRGLVSLLEALEDKELRIYEAALDAPLTERTVNALVVRDYLAATEEEEEWLARTEAVSAVYVPAIREAYARRVLEA